MTESNVSDFERIEEQSSQNSLYQPSSEVIESQSGQVGHLLHQDITESNVSVSVNREKQSSQNSLSGNKQSAAKVIESQSSHSVLQNITETNMSDSVSVEKQSRRVVFKRLKKVNQDMLATMYRKTVR